MQNQTIQRQHILLIVALIFASMISVAMLIMRFFYTGHFIFRFLAWNLFLAWLPFLFAIVVIMFPGKHYVSLLFGILWLLFFPNAPYIVTDMLHLWPRQDAPMWYDMIMIISFALTGLCLGFASLALVQGQVTARWGRAASWGFVLMALLLSGFGIYIGRFLRWNSWDVFSNPLLLLDDLLLNLTTPLLFLKTVIVTLGFTVVFTFTYVIFITLPSLTSPTLPAYSGD